MKNEIRFVCDKCEQYKIKSMMYYDHCHNLSGNNQSLGVIGWRCENCNEDSTGNTIWIETEESLECIYGCKDYPDYGLHGDDCPLSKKGVFKNE